MMQLCDLVNMIDKPFTNKSDQRIEIKSVFEVYGEIFVAYANSGGVKLVSYNEYTESIFCEKPEEDYFNIGDEIDEGVFLFAVEDRRDESVLCLALCVKLGISYPHCYIRFRNPKHLKHVRGKGVPKSEISKIYTYDNN